MLKALFPDYEWDKYEKVGFDVDGTLYDEAEFIHQVYGDIICKCHRNVSKADQVTISQFMISRWLEKGSSYPYIFKETSEKFQQYFENDFEQKALSIFRNFKVVS